MLRDLPVRDWWQYQTHIRFSVLTLKGIAQLEFVTFLSGDVFGTLTLSVVEFFIDGGDCKLINSSRASYFGIVMEKSWHPRKQVESLLVDNGY